ncbi:MAG: sel1 repeat family protein [Hyphomicrobiaceae bacterium]|nr:sel1 repeat family protein [Hyphomicrobiaceae bacterium]
MSESEGEAIIRVVGLAELPAENKFRIDPLEEDDEPLDGTGWPSGELTPREMRIGKKWVEFVVGPEVINAPRLETGMPVIFSVPSAAIATVMRWPGPPAKRPKSQNHVIVRGSSRLAEAAARAAARRAEIERLTLAAQSTVDDSATTAASSELSDEMAVAAGEDAMAAAKTVSPQLEAPDMAPDLAHRLPEISGEASGEIEARPALDPITDVVDDRTGDARFAEAVVTIFTGVESGTSGKAHDVETESVDAHPGRRDPKPPGDVFSVPHAAIGGLSLPGLPPVATTDARPDIETAFAPPPLPLKPSTLKAPGVQGTRREDGDASQLPAGAPMFLLRAKDEGSRDSIVQRAFGLGFLVAAALTLVAHFMFSSDFATLLSADRNSSALVGSQVRTENKLSSIFEVDTTSTKGRSAQGLTLADVLKNADDSLYAPNGGDKDEAKFWLRQSLALGLGNPRMVWAMTQLGSLYANPAQGQPDYAAARLLWELAGARGDPIALCFLASLHEHGLGIDADRARALELYRRAKANGGCREVGPAIARLSKGTQ